jgi:esterase/lipase
MLSNPWLRRVGPALLPFLKRSRRHLAKGERDVADRQARTESPSYPQIPLRALYQLLVLQKHVRRLLPRVRQPALVVHSRQDHTCPLSNVTVLQRRLGGPARTMLLDDSFHVVSIDVDRERVAAAVGQFVESLASPAVSHAASTTCD